jgi:hypothetical protein
MKISKTSAQSWARRIALSATALIASSATALAVLVFSTGSALANGQSGELKQMIRVGHTDLQGRRAYHPNFIDYPDGRVIAFVGTHSGDHPNPLNGGVIERNGTMIIDITDPKKPVEEFHIPGVAGAQTQSNRMCLGSDLPGGTPGHVYLMRNVQSNNPADTGYQVWDVTNVNNPALVEWLHGITRAHKPWWECNTGIAYLPGSRIVDGWRVTQSMVIVDWHDPESPPVYLRTTGLPGGQPSAAGPMPPNLHGAISAHEHPDAAEDLARSATEFDVIGNRIYLAYGVGGDGVMQVLDRDQLLPPPFGTYAGDLNDPSDAEIEEAQTAILYMSPDQGGHTSFPVFGIEPKSYEDFEDFQKRDIVVLSSESTSNACNEAPHWAFVVDVTVENSFNDSDGPPELDALPNPWQGPMVLSSMAVDPRAGEKYPRGNYCTRGARYGVHSSEENFNNPYYGRLTFLAYFTGGVRVWDIREPQSPVEVAFYVPENNANTLPAGYMTNNLEVDNRGYILAVDRNRSGLDILDLKGAARKIGLGND